MKTAVANLTDIVLGPRCIAEADFHGHRLSVQCEFDTLHRCWFYRVYIVTGQGLHEITVPSCFYRSPTKDEAFKRGLSFAVDTLLKRQIQN